MSEAIISRRGWGEGGKPELRTEYIESSKAWTVPSSIRGNVYVRIFGGGGGGVNDRYCGAGGGWMNNGEIEVNAGEQIEIHIGSGGAYNSSGRNGGSGGTTSFGVYLSANGGQGCHQNPNSRYQSMGGNGGAGGGGGGGGGVGTSIISNNHRFLWMNGGNGGNGMIRITFTNSN